MAYEDTYRRGKDTDTKMISYPGVVSRLDDKLVKKDLLSLDVCIEDSSPFSLYYFNVLRKPDSLKLGGNIFEFAPPRNRFKVDTEIKFEAIDANGNPLRYEILPKREGSQGIRICIFITENDIAGNGAITIVGEAIIDECGCPLPEECQDRLNVRWNCVTPVVTDDVSGHIEYDQSPDIFISETKIPWQYQTYEDVYNINPGQAGSAYTVSGSYTPTYNSQPTGSGTGKFYYDKVTEPTPDTQSGWPPTLSGGSGKLNVYFGNLRFSSSMVGGIVYVSGGLNHISNPLPSFNPNLHKAPAFYATISAVISPTEAEVIPAYIIKAKNPGGDVVDYAARSFNAKNGGRLTWTETSSSIAYTDPTADSSSLTRIEKTVEQHTSYADITIANLRPVCGVATDVEVFIKSNRLEGPLTKLTEFPIEPSNVALDDTRTTEKGNSKEFVDYGVFSNQNVINTYWTGSSNKTAQSDIDGQLPNSFTNTHLLNTCKIPNGTSDNITDPTNYVIFTQKDAYAKYLAGGSKYYVEFDAYADTNNNQTPRSKIDIYVSGSGIAPTNTINQDEKVLGMYIGCIENTATNPAGEKYIGNSFEFKNPSTGIRKILFVVRTGTWGIANYKLNSAPGNPSKTGLTPHSLRALIPMPAITKHNDQYSFELRYKNKNGVANKVSTFGNAQFAGNDPSSKLY